MCDRCRTPAQILRMVGADPDADDEEDEVTKAARRLRCYYQCVTEDMLDENDPFEPEGDDDDDDDLGLPRY